MVVQTAGHLPSPLPLVPLPELVLPLPLFFRGRRRVKLVRSGKDSAVAVEAKSKIEVRRILSQETKLYKERISTLDTQVPEMMEKTMYHDGFLGRDSSNYIHILASKRWPRSSRTGMYGDLSCMSATRLNVEIVLLILQAIEQRVSARASASP